MESCKCEFVLMVLVFGSDPQQVLVEVAAQALSERRRKKNTNRIGMTIGVMFGESQV